MWVTGGSQVHTTALAFSSGAEDPNSGPPACVASTLPPEPSPCFLPSTSEERLCSTLVSSSKPALKILHPIMPLLGSQNSCASSCKAFWVMWVFGALHQSVFFLDCEDLLVWTSLLFILSSFILENILCVLKSILGFGDTALKERDQPRALRKPRVLSRGQTYIEGIARV